MSRVAATAVRGTRDVLPPESSSWQWAEGIARRLCAQYHFQEIRTPIFEGLEVFQRGIGETTDIVEKEMYVFQDRSERWLALRPEGTAGVVRAFLEHGLPAGPLPVKFFYLGPMFRYERPQAGRYRQFEQFGVEAFGSESPALDVEIISLGTAFLEALGISGWQVQLNTIGCPVCRPRYRQRLLELLRPRADQLCASCQSRLERNPLRVLDCKEESCRRVTADVPAPEEYLCSECAAHWQAVQEGLRAVGILYQVTPRLVRGLDYYTRTVFELIAPGLGSQDAVLAGGRYDGLVEEMGGPAVPGIGFAAGMDRLLLSLEQGGQGRAAEPELDVFVARAGDVPETAALQVVQELRKQGWRVDQDYLGRSLKAQLKAADRAGAQLTLVLGEAEWAQGQVVVRTMATGEQETVNRAVLTQAVTTRLQRTA
ncbi:MAG: histidine--tRNA ligase [Limnochordaceae bacterium]|nr:histidine--tRNA ligase [Limnochordaceae bacterium]